MRKLPYGYRLLLRRIIWPALALLWIKIFYPTENSTPNFYLYADGLQYFLAKLALLIVVFYWFVHVLDLAEKATAPRTISSVFNVVGGIIALGIVIALGRECFFLGKRAYLSINETDYDLDMWWYILKREWKEPVRILIINAGIPFAIAFLPAEILMKIQHLRENRTFRQIFSEGRGGSARWASTPTYQRHEAKASQVNSKIILGRSLFDDDPERRIVGIGDDAHLITIGMTGSGKSTTVLLPNLAMYGGSAIILDPKGELAMATFQCRSSKYWLKEQTISERVTHHHRTGRSFVLDPFGETQDLPRNNYNLLSEVDINSDRVRELLSAISDGCVTPEGEDNKHFEEMAKYFIEGIIAHVLSRYPEEYHNLPFVFDLVHGIDRDLKVADPTRFNELLYVMMKNDAAGGLPQQVAAKILEMGDREKGSVLSTIARSLKWIGDPAMRKHLETADFKFSELNTVAYVGPDQAYHNATSVYIVLPDGLMKEQMRWLRCLISVSLTLIKNVKEKPSIPTLFVMDEFPRLGGKIEAIAEGFGILRGYGIKLWAFVQDIGQLQEDYPERWSSMTANSTVQVFGVNDLETAEWVSETVGSAIQRRKEGRIKKKVIHEAVYPLLTPNEVIMKLGKTENRQLVRTAEGFPMRLERCSYKPLELGKHGFYELAPGALKGCFTDWRD